MKTISDSDAECLNEALRVARARLATPDGIAPEVLDLCRKIEQALTLTPDDHTVQLKIGERAARRDPKAFDDLARIARSAITRSLKQSEQKEAKKRQSTLTVVTHGHSRESRGRVRSAKGVRSAVRLSAVASAGSGTGTDGPPSPAEPPIERVTVPVGALPATRKQALFVTRAELRRELARLLHAFAVLVESANDADDSELEQPRRAARAPKRTAATPSELTAKRAAAALRRAGVRP